MYTVHGDRPVEAPVYRTALHIGAVHFALHMEMNRIAAEAKRLTRVRHLDMVEVSDSETFAFVIGVHHDLYTELITSTLLTVPAVETCLRGELVRIELRRTCFNYLLMK